MRYKIRKVTKNPRFKKIVGVGSIMDQTNWRKFYTTEGTNFDDIQKLLFLNLIKIKGRKFEAAQAAGVTYNTVKKHMLNDPEFNEAVLLARGLYADRVKRTVEKIALDGIDEPIIGGINRDKVVATKKVYATNVLIQEMKRTDSDYKDTKSIDVTVKAGVLVVPGGMTMEEWERIHGKQLAIDTK